MIDTDKRGIDPTLAGLGGALLAAACLGAGFVTGRRRASPGGRTSVSTFAVPSTVATSDTAVPDTALAEDVIALMEIADDEVFAARLRLALIRGGVESIDPTGVRFDPARHTAVARLEALAGEEPGMVTGVRREGWRLGDQIIRQPEVFVAASAHESGER